MSLRLITDADLDAYEAEQKARLELTSRYEWAVRDGDKLEVRRVEALIAAHDYLHGTQLLAEVESLTGPIQNPLHLLAAGITNSGKRGLAPTAA